MQNAIRLISFFLVMILLRQGQAAAEQADQTDQARLETLMAMSLKELMEMEVTSASKRSQKINEAPSPIYVFTAEDIQRTGVRNIMELVKYVPGFYVYPRIDQPFVIANRGIRSSSNDKILFLIDGIPINNISKSGAVNADKFPGLDMVKRIEVIPGPGSTMWGSDAALGIISIITKDAKDIDGNIVNIDLATEDNHRQANFLSGKEFSEGEYMLSATYAENDGFGVEKNGYKNYVFDFGSIPWNDQHANFNHLHPSYEIFGKLRIKDFTFKALVSEKSIYSFWTTSQSTDYHDKIDQESTIFSRDIHLELSHHGKLSDNMTLDTKITAKRIEYERDRLVDKGSNHGSDFIDDPDDPNDVFKEPIHRTEKYPEKGLGLEFILNWDINEKHKLLAGTQIRVAEAGPGEFKYFDVNTGQKTSETVKYNKTTDRSYGAYIEDTYHATDKLTLIGGVRIDYNDPRDKTGVVMPRGAAICKLSDAVSVKYMYNTGYFRPSMDKSSEVALTLAGSVKESEKIRSHDVALIYKTEKTQLIVDVFYMTIYDRNVYDLTQNAHVDAGDIWSQGLEVSFKRSFMGGKLIFDLNYGYAKAKTEDKFGHVSNSYEGIPHHVYAAGLNYLFTDKISLYANINGWADLEMHNVPATAWYATPAHPNDYDGDYLVDLNLRFANLFDNHLNVSLYVLNAFDKEARLQALEPNYMSWWSYARGRSVGIKASWKF